MFYKKKCEPINYLTSVLKVLTYAQQSRERSNYEQAALIERMQEYKRQIDRESRWSSNGLHSSPNGDGIQAIGRSSHKMIEAVMQSAAKGKVSPKGLLNYYKTIISCFNVASQVWYIARYKKLAAVCLTCLLLPMKIRDVRFKQFDKVTFQSAPRTWEVTGREGFSFLIAEECCITIASNWANHL